MVAVEGHLLVTGTAERLQLGEELSIVYVNRVTTTEGTVEV